MRPALPDQANPRRAAGPARAFAGRRKDRVFSRFPLYAILCETRPAATPSVTFFVWICLRAQRFGSTRSYQGSVVGITDERMRQLAEHFTP